MSSRFSGGSSLQLVQIAVADRTKSKAVGAELGRRPPDGRAAAWLVEAYRAGEASAWLTAFLLGRLRHPVGYETACEILQKSEGKLSESYAGVALVRIAGAEAVEDLEAVLFGSPYPKAREGAAYGLAWIRPSGFLEMLMSATVEEKISINCAKILIAEAQPENALLVEWFDGGESQRRLVMRTIAELIRRGAPPGFELARSVVEEMNSERFVPRADRVLLEKWLGRE